MRTKSQAQHLHAKKRAKERYGLSFNRKDKILLVKKIQEGKSVHSKAQTGRTTIHWIRFKERPVKVVYDKQRKTIVTFLHIKNKDLKYFG